MKPVVQQAFSGDTYHNRVSPDSKYKGNDKYRKLPKKCAKCGTTKGPFDIHHTNNSRKDLSSTKGLQVLCRSCHRKLHAKLNGGRGEFVLSTAARIIQDPQTKESEAIAKTHQNSDLMHVEFILCHANTNKNQDAFTSADLKDNASTAINKPINWQHKDYNIGTIYQSKFVSLSELSEEDQKYYGEVDPLKYDFVACRAAIWEYKHPTEARIMRDRAAEGRLYFSMENVFSKASCSKCGETFDRFYDYCDHLLDRHKTGEASRVFVGSNFVGAAVVDNPADEDAGTLAVANFDIDTFPFVSILNSKLLEGVDVEKVIIPYIITAGKDMEINKVDNIPSEFIVDLDIPNESFADDINRLFPIDNFFNTEVSAKLALNNSLDFYEDAAKLIVIERIVKAAKEYDIKLEIEHKGGSNNMAIDTNSPEFKAAVASQVQTELEKLDTTNTLDELKKEIDAAKAEKEAIQAKADAIEAEKKKAEQEFEDYKKSIAAKEIAEARLNTLTEKGFAFDRNKELVEKGIANMTDDAFASFIDVISEAKEMGQAEVKVQKEDIVAESKETAIANKVEGATTKDNDPFPMFSKMINNIGK